MQGTRDSPNLRRVAGIVKAAEEWARESVEKLMDHLRGAGEPVIAYSSLGYSPASILYWLVTTCAPEKHPTLHDADTIAIYRLVYREKALVTAFTTQPSDPSMIRLADAARWTGCRLLIVSPKPPDMLAEMLRGTPVLEVPVSDEITASMYEAFLALYTGVKQCTRLGRRIDRIKRFIEEGYSTILEELASQYSSLLKNIRIHKRVVIASTRILEPASYVLVEALARAGVDASYTPITLAKPGRDPVLLIVSTGAEEHVVREKKTKAVLRGSKVYELSLNMDPLELPVYIHILALTMIM